MNSELIFVSYSSSDRPFAMHLAEKLEQLGARIWIDQHHIQLGEDWDNSIEKALDSSDTLLLIISSTAVDSENVKDEVSIAIQENKRLVPILIAPCELPMRWKRKHYADFVSQPDKAIKDLVKALGLKEDAAERLRDLKELLKDSGVALSADNNLETSSKKELENATVHLEDTLISVAEIDQAILMHKRGIKRNIQLIIIVGVISMLLLAVLSYFPVDVSWPLILAGCLLLNLLSVRPFGGIRNRQRKIELLELIKLKRERLVRIVNKLDQDEVEGFNSEFLTYISL